MTWSGAAVLPFFGDLKPQDVTQKLCRAYAALRRKAKRGSAAQQVRYEASGRPVPVGVSDSTIRTELNQLRTALLWAESVGLIVKAPAIEMPGAGQAQDRHLTREEFDRLLAAAETPHLRLYLLLAISTAGRNAALLELTWDRVDFDRGLVFLGPRHILRPQKGRATVPMTSALRAALSNAHAYRRTDRVIEWAGEPVRSVRTALAGATRRADLSKVTPHMIRHSAAVWMAEAGRPMGEVAAFLGHSDDIITQRVYARFSPSYLRGSAQALEVGGPRANLKR